MGLSKSERKRHVAALDSFHTYYSSTTNWGTRWASSLYPSLAEAKVSVALSNPFLPSDSSTGPEVLTSLTPATFPFATSNLHILEADTIPPPQDAAGLKSHYVLDPASLLPPLLLSPKSEEHVLDLCAAPGGKSLALAGMMFASPCSGTARTGSLTVNEVDAARFARLQGVLKEYLPLEVREKVKAVRHDGLLGLPLPEGGGYDAVLLDAPCGSERHVVHAWGKAERGGRACPELLGFRAGTAGKRGIIKVQTGLLREALRVVKVGGRVVYSTCSVDRGENEGVIKSVLAGGGVDVVDSRKVLEGVEEVSEECEVGRICLPDHRKGWGPIFFCVLRKVA
ncbi:S-adenosyl-L-methionine-dependent methyltransferase [Myriangium duriaei CBS 260.36]|uniref:NOL1/NOP2/Sun domain family member 4 n=1 Tax=Myriangium duriaei CBS 260.36 TaxID=1168546 RepID=A0A9P4ITK8_9PEZI|nr:S-adenosyl-L-methionine-dependent methyltransferase [Myriangium duriaei CBS 260.36]